MVVYCVPYEFALLTQHSKKYLLHHSVCLYFSLVSKDSQNLSKRPKIKINQFNELIGLLIGRKFKVLNHNLFFSTFIHRLANKYEFMTKKRNIINFQQGRFLSCQLSNMMDKLQW